ncbi:MAG: metallophosphoesterase family protein [Erysipelotrichaceae bacterium]|nr:metallophosphoesterase family protein [Erysipelotrichaceae bacterium]MBR5048315.1 metallophosphoesterase family protein [Erysipelotrichaceae bacterium]
MKYYISDPHFHHRFCEDMDHRGFETMFEMHEYMIRKWNERVTDDDDVFVVGDFSFGNGRETWEILNRLRGKITLVEGNHDGFYLDDREFTDTFENVAVYYEIRDGSREVILCHYPMPFYNHQYRRDREGQPLTYMLYGHIHNTFDEYYLSKVIERLSEVERYGIDGQIEKTPFRLINTFCMYSDYVPLTLDEWIVVDGRRRQLVADYERQLGRELTVDDWEKLNEVIVRRSREKWQ